MAEDSAEHVDVLVVGAGISGIDAAWRRSGEADVIGSCESDCGLLGASAPGVIRTRGQRFRKPLLYPSELRGRVGALSWLATVSLC